MIGLANLNSYVNPSPTAEEIIKRLFQRGNLSVLQFRINSSCPLDGAQVLLRFSNLEQGSITINPYIATRSQEIFDLRHPGSASDSFLNPILSLESYRCNETLDTLYCIPQYGTLLSSPSIQPSKVQRCFKSPLGDFCNEHKVPYGHPLIRKATLPEQILIPKDEDNSNNPFFNMLVGDGSGGKKVQLERTCASLHTLRPLTLNWVSKQWLKFRYGTLPVNIVGAYKELFVTDRGITIPKSLLKKSVQNSQVLSLLSKLESLGMSDILMVPEEVAAIIPDESKTPTFGGKKYVLARIVGFSNLGLQSEIHFRDLDGDAFTTDFNKEVVEGIRTVPFPEELI